MNPLSRISIRLAALVFLFSGVLAAPLSAQTNFFWMIATNGAFTTSGRWSNNLANANIPALGGSVDYFLTFAAGASGTAYAVTNDQGSASVPGGGFLVNRLNFAGPTVNLYGSNFTMVANANGGLPQINFNSSNNRGVILFNDLVLSNDTSFGGTQSGGTEAIYGAISGAGALLRSSGTYILILSNAANSYAGGTIINTGGVRFDLAGAIGGSGRNVLVNTNGTVVLNFAGVQNVLTNRIRADSLGTVALGAGSANENVDFAAASLTNAFLGAAGGFTVVYGGTYTPFTNTFRFGGGGGTLILTNAFIGNTNILVSGAAVASGNVPGLVILSNANSSQSGTITVINGGILQLASDGVLGNAANGVTLSNSTLVAGGNMTLGAGRTINLAGGTTGVLATASSAVVLTLDQPGHLSGSGALWITNNSVVAITANQTSWTGTNIILGFNNLAYLRANEGVGLSNNVNLVFNGGVLEQVGNTTFTRTNGTGPGAFSTFTSGRNLGWSAVGGTQTVNIGGSGGWVAWNTSSGTNAFGAGSITLNFGSSNADGMVDFVNPLNLMNAGRTVTVTDNPGTNTDIARISGRIFGGGNRSQLTKNGSGTLWLTNANSMLGGTNIINAGVLRARDGVGLAADGTLVINGSSAVFEGDGAGSFLRLIGTGAGQLVWTNGGGFSAWGGKLTVNLGTNGPVLVWGSTANFLRAGETMYFGSSNSDSEVEFQNGLDLNGGPRTVQVNDNTLTNGDFTTISGVIANGTLIKAGAGKLVLSGANTYAGGTTNSAGILALGANNVLGSGTLVFAGGGLAVNGDRVLSNAVNVGVASVVDTTGGSLLLSGVLSNTFGLSKTGSGTLSLSGSNLWSGTLAVNAGQVVLGGTWAAQNAVVSNMVSGGLAFSNANAFTLFGLSGTGNVSLVNVADGSGVALTLTSNSTFRGTLSGGSLAKTGGFLTLGAGGSIDASTPVTITAGNITLSGGTLVQDTLVATNLPMGLTLGYGTLTVSNGFTLSVGQDYYFGGAANRAFTMNVLGGASNSLASTAGLHFGNTTGMTVALNFLGGTSYNNAVNGSLIIGEGVSSTQSLTVAGAETVFSIPGRLQLAGAAGAVGYLTVSNGGTLNFTAPGNSSPLAIGSVANNRDSVLLVDNGTLNTLGHAVYFGVGATNMTFMVTNGGRAFVGGVAMSNPSSYVGGINASSNLVVVSGSGSVITNSGGTTIGGSTNSTYNRLLVLDGGNLIHTGTSGLALGGSTNAYGNSAVVSGSGSLLVAPKITLGSVSPNSTNNVLWVDSGGTIALGSGGISAGAGSGGVYFDNATLLATAGSGFFISNGVSVFLRSGGLYLDDGGSNLTIQANMVDDASSPGGSLTKLNSGSVTLLGNNTYSGGTVISNGVLQVGTNNGVVGSLAGSIANHGTLAFSRGDTFISSNAISGTGNLLKLGSGTMVLVSNSTHTGGTIVSNGVLQLGSGGANGWVGGDVITLGSLAFNRSDDVTFSNKVLGLGGSLIQAGPGTLVFTGVATNQSLTNSGGTFVLDGGGSIYVTNGVDVGGGGNLVVLSGTINDVSPQGNALRVGGASDGSITLAGPNALLMATNGTTRIGQSAAGSLVVSNGIFLAKAMEMGSATGGQGTFTMLGGTGVVAGTLYVGSASGGTGNLVVAGSGTLLNVSNAGSLIVGNGVGTFGSMLVTNGGNLSVAGAINLNSSRGLAVFSNAGSVILGAGIVVGTGGTSNLMLLDGSTMTAGSTVILGNGAGNYGNELVLQNGSQLGVASTFYLSNARGSNNVVRLLGGSVLDIASSIAVGQAVGAFSNQVYVREGSRMVVGGSTYVGGTGGGASLGVLAVSGTGSVILANSALRMHGTNNFLHVADGGLLSVKGGDFIVGQNAGGIGNLLLVEGAGSIVSNSASNFYLNYDGYGNRMVVSNGGLVYSSTAVTLGSMAGVSSGEVLVGPGGNLTVASMTVGAGAGAVDNVLRVRGPGATFTNLGALTIGSGASSSGSLFSLDEGASASVAGVLAIGVAGSGTATFGDSLFSGGTVRVGTGASGDGTWNLFGGTSTLSTLSVSYGGPGTLVMGGNSPTLLVTNGLGSLTIGDTASNSFGAFMIMSNGYALAMNVKVAGRNANQGNLTLYGGTFEAAGNGQDLSVAANPGSTGTVTLAGAGAFLVDTSVASNASLALGMGNDSMGVFNLLSGTALLRGFALGGGSNGFGRIVIGGGTLLTPLYYNTVGQTLNGVGEILLTDANSRFVTTNNTGTFVGSYGVGRLTISNGTLLADDLMLARYAGAQGFASLLGGQAILKGTLTVGNLGYGSFLMTNGTLLEIGSGLVVASATPSNSFLNAGGLLQFTTGTPTVTPNGTGSVVVANGTVSFRGVANAAVRGQITNITYSGANTLRLDASTNASVASYSIAPGMPFSTLELINGSTLWQGGGLTIGSGGSLLVSNTAASIDSAFTNQGSVRVVDATLAFQQSLLVTSNASFTLVHSTNVLNGGLVISSNAFYGGSGRVESGSGVNNFGTISPGNSPGTLTFSSNLTLLDSSLLVLELAGTNALDFDHLVIEGVLSKNGSVLVTNLGWAFAAGDTFDFIDAAGLSGNFSHLVLPTLADDIQWDTSLFETQGILSVMSIPEPSPMLAVGVGLVLLAFLRRRSSA